MTVGGKGDDLSLVKSRSSIAKLEDVREVKELKAEHSICRELVIVTVGVTPEERTRTDLSCECTASCKHCGY